MRNIGLIMSKNVVIKSYIAQFLSNKKYLCIILSMDMFEQEYRSFIYKQLGITEEGSFSFENDSVTVTYNPEKLDQLETFDLRNDPEPTKEYMLDAIKTGRPFLVKMKVSYYDEHYVPYVDRLSRQHYPDLKVTIAEEMAFISYLNGNLETNESKA